MTLKRLSARILALALSLSVTAGTVFADTWYLENGDITVDTGSGTQMISQGGSAPQEDLAPVITQSNPDTETPNSVTITGGNTANVTIENVNINADSGPGIDVQGSTTANITAQGANSVKATENHSAAIHVSEGKLNLNTTEGSSIAAGAQGSFKDGAGIGSHQDEDMSGEINLSGKGSVNAESSGGAGIGSGNDGNMTGTITTGAGTVTAESRSGAGIGSGAIGQMSGSITTGSGEVTAKAFGGAGIGSGYHGDVTGTIITGSGKVTAVSYQGAGIGSGGSHGNMSGTIITGEGVVDAASSVGAGIGSGAFGQMSGDITTGSGEVFADSITGAGIGSGSGGDMTGSVTTGSGPVTAESGLGAGIGSGSSYPNHMEFGGTPGDMTGTVTTGSGKVTATSTNGAGIGAGNYGTMKGTVNIAEDSGVTAESAQADAIGGTEGKVDPKAQLNVEKGAWINGQTFDSPKTILGQQIPEAIPAKAPSAPSAPSDPAPAAPAARKSFYSRDLYWTLSDRNAVVCTENLEGGVLTLTADREDAQLHFTAYSLRQLKNQGVETVIFRTAGLESSFDLASVLDQGDLLLIHAGGRAELRLGGEVSDLLK